MRDDHDDVLWRLLGSAKQTPVSPFFSRNVMRKVRNLKPLRRKGSWRAWLIPSAACLTVAVATLFLLPLSQPSIAFRPGSDDFEMITQLDQMIATEVNDAWLDVSLF